MHSTDAEIGEQRPAPRTVAVAINPSTRRSASVVRRAVAASCPDGVDLYLVEIPEPGGGAEVARRFAGVDLMVAAGGDGTVADVATGLIGSSTPLAILPAGSTNIVAQEIGVPLALGPAVQRLFGPHRIVRRDAGLVGDRYFLHMAGAGLDAHFFTMADRELKRRVGWVAYVPAAFEALRLPPTHFTITTESERLEVVAPMVLVANGGSVIHPRITLDPSIRPDDGVFDVLVFTALDQAAIARTVARLAAFRLPGSPDMLMFKARQVTIESDQPVPVQLDGDVHGWTPTTMNLVPKCINLAVAHPRPGLLGGTPQLAR